MAKKQNISKIFSRKNQEVCEWDGNGDVEVSRMTSRFLACTTGWTVTLTG